MTKSDNLTPEELNLIELIIKNPFMPDVKLAELTGIHRTTISKMKSRPHIQEKIKEFTISNIERFNEIQSEALEVMHGLFASESDLIRLQAAKTFVEGLKTTKIEAEISGKIVYLDKQDANL